MRNSKHWRSTSKRKKDKSTLNSPQIDTDIDHRLIRFRGADNNMSHIEQTGKLLDRKEIVFHQNNLSTLQRK